MEVGSRVCYVGGSMRGLMWKMVAVLALGAWIGPVPASALSEGKASDAAASLSSETNAGDEALPYDLSSSRDPFRPYVQTLGRQLPQGELTPLQQYELSQLRLVAIITDEHNLTASRAVVEDSAGLGYILRVGTPIGRASGRVTAIERDRVVVEQWTSNVFGEEQRSVIVKELDAGEEAKR